MAKLPVRNRHTRKAGKFGRKHPRKIVSGRGIEANSARHAPAPNESLGPAPSPAVVAPPLPLSEPASETAGPPDLAFGTGPWFSQYEAVAGLAHRDRPDPLPCQDAALAGSDPRPWLLLADGAGSSAVSEIGARCVVSGLNRLLHTLERPVADLLDAKRTPAPEEARQLALQLVKHARGLLADLAAEHRRPLKDFRCTLLLAVLGQRHLLWLKIGDGALVIERTQAAAAENGERPAGLETLGHAGKGEFANQTTFIDEQLQPRDVQSGLLSMEGIGGVALMSDGAAERLVSQDGRQVSGQLGLWFQALRENRLKRRSLTQRFYAEDFTDKTSGDDCSIALTARPLRA